MFPEFTSVADVTVQEYIDMAAQNVDQSWLETDYNRAIKLLAAHLMALVGLGTGPDSVANGSNMSVYSLVKSGTLTLQRKASASSDRAGWQFSATRYGRLFWILLRQNRGGPRVAVGVGAIPSGYAKDWPNA